MNKTIFTRDWPASRINPRGDAEEMFKWIVGNKEKYKNIRIIMLECSSRHFYFTETLRELTQFCQDYVVALRAQGVERVEITYNGAEEESDVVWLAEDFSISDSANFSEAINL